MRHTKRELVALVQYGQRECVKLDTALERRDKLIDALNESLRLYRMSDEKK